MKKTFTRNLTTMMTILIVIATIFTMTGCKKKEEKIVNATPDEIVATVSTEDEIDGTTYSETTEISETNISTITSSSTTNPTTEVTEEETTNAPVIKPSNNPNSINGGTSHGVTSSNNNSNGNGNSTSTNSGTTSNQHIHSYGRVVINPTCTKKGYTEYSCSCGDSYNGATTNALGHNWSSWKTVKEATTEAEGKQQRICSRCNKTENKTIDKIKGKYDVYAVPGNESLLEERILYYLNQYKGDNCAPKEWKMQQYADMRAVQLASDFSHNLDDIRGLAEELQYGSYVDPSYYGDPDGIGYWQPACTEAIVQAGPGSFDTVDYEAKQIAKCLYNSASHWKYVGAADTNYLAVGVYYANSSWYVCVAVSA